MLSGTQGQAVCKTEGLMLDGLRLNHISYIQARWPPSTSICLAVNWRSHLTLASWEDEMNWGSLCFWKWLPKCSSYEWLWESVLEFRLMSVISRTLWPSRPGVVSVRWVCGKASTGYTWRKWFQICVLPKCFSFYFLSLDRQCPNTLDSAFAFISTINVSSSVASNIPRFAGIYLFFYLISPILWGFLL